MYPQGYMYPRGYVYSQGYMYPRGYMYPHGLSCTLMHPHHSALQCITVHPSASQCIPVHHTSSDSIRLYQTLIHLQKMQIDGKRSKLISGGIEGSSGEVSASRSRIFGSRPKKLIVKKWGVQKGPGSNFRWSPGRPPKNGDGRSFCLWGSK